MDALNWVDPVKVDDFIVAIGVKKSNSIYHVAEVKARPHPKLNKMTRYHMKVFKSDLMTALKRDEDQKLIPVEWYKR